MGVQRGAAAIAASPVRVTSPALLRKVFAVIPMLLIALLLLVAAAWLPGIMRYSSIPVTTHGLDIPYGAVMVEQPVSVIALRPGAIISFGASNQLEAIVTARVVALHRGDVGGNVALLTQPLDGGQAQTWEVAAGQPAGQMVYWVPLVGLLENYTCIPGLGLVLIVAGALLLWLTNRPGGQDPSLAGLAGT